LETNQLEIISTGCDWITGVALTPQSHMHMSLWVGQVLDHQKGLGNKVSGWGMAGFSGWSVGHVQAGIRGDEMMVRLSSSCAYLNWKQLYALSDNVTRIDWQVTYRGMPDVRKTIRKAHHSALRWSNKQKRGPSVTLVTSSDGSDTLYLGKRQSDSMGRVYNKGVESKQREFDGCVRAEVEWKGKLAKIAGRRLDDARSPFVAGFNQVCSFFKRRGVDLGLVHDL
jgi:DNA relaxase NicK